MAAASTKPFSISFGSKKKLSIPTAKTTTASLPSSNSATKKRPHSALADADSDHEELSGPQLVTGFDQSIGGAIGSTPIETKAPLIIQAQRNRDWREEARRRKGKNLLPAEVQAAATPVAVNNIVSERDEISTEAGLKITKLTIVEDIDGACVQDSLDDQRPTDEIDKPKKTVDEEAIEALLGKEKKSTLSIPTSESTYQNGTASAEPDFEAYRNEDDRFKADVAARPESSNLDDYAAVPVEEFGAALLRGMGWKEGEALGKSKSQQHKVRIVERRPALLGIGAKEVPTGIGEELGAWGKATKGKRKTNLAYNPILLKNSGTGELLTEEELERKKEEAKRPKEGRDRNRDHVKEDDRARKHDRPAIEDGSVSRSNGTTSSKPHRHRDRERSQSRDRRKYHNGDGRASASRHERSKSRERSHRKYRRDDDRDYRKSDGDYRRR